MWAYEKKLQYPVNIKNPNPALAKLIITQLGGPDGELGASLRYLSQRYAMPYSEAVGILTDIGREGSEMFHFGADAFLIVRPADNLCFLQPYNSTSCKNAKPLCFASVSVKRQTEQLCLHIYSASSARAKNQRKSDFLS